MTPLDDKGAADLKQEIKDVGKELHDPTLSEAQRNAAAAKLRRLERRIDRLAESKTDDDTGKITDPTVRQLMSKVNALTETVSDLVVKRDPELQAIEQHFEDILDEYPEIAAIKNPTRRIEAVKAIAARRFPDTRSKDDAAEDRGEDVSRAYRQTGSSPVTTRRQAPPHSVLEKKLSEAKSAEERAAIIDEWNQANPE